MVCKDVRVNDGLIAIRLISACTTLSVKLGWNLRWQSDFKPGEGMRSCAFASPAARKLDPRLVSA